MKTMDIQQAANIILGGGVIAFPTETFYGLAVDPLNPEALHRLLMLKGRDAAKGIPVIASSADVVHQHFQSTAHVRAASCNIWPAPLSLALTPGSQVPSALCGDFDTVAVRVSALESARELAESAGGLITATSANLSGEPPAGHPDELHEDVRSAVDLVLDGGRTPGGKPSTIIGFTEVGFKVFREGAYPLSQVEKQFEAICQN